MNFFEKILERRPSKKELLFIDRQCIVFSYLHEFVKEKTKKSKNYKILKINWKFYWWRVFIVCKWNPCTDFKFFSQQEIFGKHKDSEIAAGEGLQYTIFIRSKDKLNVDNIIFRFSFFMKYSEVFHS